MISPLAPAPEKLIESGPAAPLAEMIAARRLPAPALAVFETGKLAACAPEASRAAAPMAAPAATPTRRARRSCDLRMLRADT